MKETIFKYIKLPFVFNHEAMLAEVNLLADLWLAHYNQRDYTGEWNALPLRSVDGNVTNAVAVQSVTAAFKDTPLMAQCPTIKAALDVLQCEKTSVRVLNLKAGATVKEHKDPGLFYEEGEIRLHIPLTTNELVEFYIEDERMNLQPGECWYMNFDLRHRLTNPGTDDRIHLVIDCLVNDWVHTLFASCPPADVKSIPLPEKFTKEDKYQIIEQLKLIGTEAALSMAKEMENELVKQ